MNIQDSVNQCRQWLIEIYERQGKFQQAREQLHKLLAANPDDEEIELYGKTMRQHISRRSLFASSLLSAPTTFPVSQENYEALSLQGLEGTSRLPQVQRFELIDIPYTQEIHNLLGNSTFLMETVSTTNMLWFVLKQKQWEELVHLHYGHTSACSTLQAQLNREFDLMKPQPFQNEFTISRRQALATIASIPITFRFGSQKRRNISQLHEEFLPACAASIIACRHLINGNELVVVEQILSTYMPTLETLAQYESSYQRTAAELTSQAYRLKSLLAWHRLQRELSETYGKKAIDYARLSQVPNLLVATSLLYVTRDAEKTLQIHQELLPDIESVSPFLQSAAWMGAAWAYAQQQDEQMMMNCRERAYTFFPKQPHLDSSFFYGEFGHPWMLLWEALSYRSLSQHMAIYEMQAWNTFTQLSTPQPSQTVPARMSIEAINYQAEAAAKRNDLDLFCYYLEKGVKGAETVGSEKRRQEAFAAWKKALEKWPHEQRIVKLVELFAKG